MSNGEVALERILRAFKMALNELVALVPVVLASVLIIALMLVIAKYVGSLVKRILKIVGLDRILEKYVGTPPISVENFIVIFIQLGFIILGITISVTVFAPEYLAIYNMYLSYVLRLMSAVALIIITLFWIEVLVNKIRGESKVKAFASLIAFLLILTFIIDVTALSESVKSSLVFGISLGLGLTIGVFSIWYFMHEYLEHYISRKHGGEEVRQG